MLGANLGLLLYGEVYVMFYHVTLLPGYPFLSWPYHLSQNITYDPPTDSSDYTFTSQTCLWKGSRVIIPFKLCVLPFCYNMKCLSVVCILLSTKCLYDRFFFDNSFSFLWVRFIVFPKLSFTSSSSFASFVFTFVLLYLSFRYLLYS